MKSTWANLICIICILMFDHKNTDFGKAEKFSVPPQMSVGAAYAFKSHLLYLSV